MKVSIVLPVYNVSKELDKCLESIMKQKYNNYEIILVNDGSTDDSGIICDSYCEKYDNIKVFHQKNSGSGIARNNGLSHAKGKYIFFCDPDDYISGELFFDLDGLMEKNIDVIQFGYWDNINNIDFREMNINCYRYLDENEFQKQFISFFRTNTMYTIWNKLYRRKFLIENELQFGNYSMGQDTRFNLTVYQKLKSFQACNNSYYHYVMGRPNSSMTKFREDRYKYKLEEYELIKNVVYEFSTEQSDLKIKKFLVSLKKYIYVDAMNHILFSNLSWKKRKFYIKNINKEFSVFLSENTANIIYDSAFFLLKYRMYLVYKLLKNAKQNIYKL